ncbi:hypothetical protein [uncultured Methylophaga sp.]|uniref:hypothetical protein n=1 Tax=uncultured Methylophaga sp. TaxID=285271 RepID=UPI002622D418|nr:hypothetical protein [uncultured Methylophaga sp.]
MLYRSLRFEPLMVFNHLSSFTNSLWVKLIKKIAARRLEAEKSLTILPRCFPTTAFKITSTKDKVVVISNTFNNSNVRFYSPNTPSLRELRILLGIMRLAIKACHYNEFDEGGALETTLSDLRNTAGIGSNLNNIKSSLATLSKIRFTFEDEEAPLLKYEQLKDIDGRLRVLSLKLHPIFAKTVLNFVKKNELGQQRPPYSIYYITDLMDLSDGDGARTAQALYIYYSSTIDQGGKSFKHSKTNLCEKIYNLVYKSNGKPVISGGDRRQLSQGIRRLAEVGWLITIPTRDIYIAKRPKRHGKQRPKLLDETAINSKGTNQKNKGKKRPAIVRANQPNTV